MEANRKDHWERVYEEKAEDELSWHQDVPTVSLELAELAGLTADWSVVDIGGGTSRFVECMAGLGVDDLTVVDLSRTALDANRKSLGAHGASVKWVATDVTTWDPGRQFDLWHDRAVFHFLVEPEDRHAYIDRLLRSLKHGAFAIIGTFAPDGPDKCSGLPVARYSPESLGATLGDHFDLIAQRSQIHRTPWGSSQSFQFSLFSKID